MANSGDDRWTFRICAIVTTVAVAVALIHLIWPDLKIDVVTVLLLVIAILPWLRGVVDSVDVPVLGSVKFREMQKQVIVREQQETREAVQAIATAGDAVPQDERLSRIYELADRYEEIRESMSSGFARTASMNMISRDILGLMPITQYDPDGNLHSSRAGRRLVAYLSLMASPGREQADALVQTLTEREGIPFNQSWALRALDRIVQINGSSCVSGKSIARLKGMRDGLKPGLDRQLLLVGLVDELTS